MTELDWIFRFLKCADVISFYIHWLNFIEETGQVKKHTMLIGNCCILDNWIIFLTSHSQLPKTRLYSFVSWLAPLQLCFLSSAKYRCCTSLIVDNTSSVPLKSINSMCCKETVNSSKNLFTMLNKMNAYCILTVLWNFFIIRTINF